MFHLRPFRLLPSGWLNVFFFFPRNSLFSRIVPALSLFRKFLFSPHSRSSRKQPRLIMAVTYDLARCTGLFHSVARMSFPPSLFSPPPPLSHWGTPVSPRRTFFYPAGLFWQDCFFVLFSELGLCGTVVFPPPANPSSFLCNFWPCTLCSFLSDDTWFSPFFL